VTGHISLALSFSCPCTGGEKVTGRSASLTVTAGKNASHGKQVLFVNDTKTGKRLATAYWTPGQTPKPLVVSIAPGQQLSVYAGTYTLKGSLKYQKYYTSPALPTA
jgi:hypothetical protein